MFRMINPTSVVVVAPPPHAAEKTVCVVHTADALESTEKFHALSPGMFPPAHEIVPDSGPSIDWEYVEQR